MTMPSGEARQRIESEYPKEVRQAGPRGRSLYDQCVAGLMTDGMSDEEASMIALLHFPALFARLEPVTESESQA